MAALSTGALDRAAGSAGVSLRLHQASHPSARIDETSPQNLGAGAERAEVSMLYSDTRTSFHFGKMLDTHPGQFQDNFNRALQHPRASESQPVQRRTQSALCSVFPVPRLDEAIAAAALTSLSSGPMVLGTGTGFHGASYPENVVISSSSSSSNSCELYTSIPSTPSPPLQPAPSFVYADAGLEDSDTTHFLFGEPGPRKRKNSGRLMFCCLWKNCGKVLSTSAAIQKHIRTAHLGPCSGPGHNDGEEDFYYTEVDVNVDTLTDGLSSLTPTSPTTTGPPPFPCAVSLGAGNNTELPLVSPLSLSAPSTLCHVHTDHAYQAPSPISMSVTSKVSFSWQSPPPLLIKAAPVCPTLNISEKRPQILTSPPNSKQVPGTRKPRGEAKKCRKVYGMERKDMWCTACRWKKACQRFID
ncbi:SLC2A4 regulator isoform X2 [Hyla sarda]|uniref:SLC2A4 regulator isoform X2 n=1 Tax=Hyla sarda TaxID=327740 RepID=UPI0024C27648|nr:SLC2A4 regulator isoform X2 [Hyla sarda]